MPVRIYDLAKELRIESKIVLAKAKALGMTAAKVPSSSLDKITAEFLKDELVKESPQPQAPAPAPAVPIIPPAPPAPISIITERTLELEPAPAPVEALPGVVEAPAPPPLVTAAPPPVEALESSAPALPATMAKVVPEPLPVPAGIPPLAPPPPPCRLVCLRLVKRWGLSFCRQSRRPARRPRNRPPVLRPEARLILRGAAICAVFEAGPRLRPPSLFPARKPGRKQRKNPRPALRRPSRTNLFRSLPAK